MNWNIAELPPYARDVLWKNSCDLLTRGGYQDVVGWLEACESCLAEPRLPNFELPSLSALQIGVSHALQAPPAARLSVKLKTMGYQSFSA